MAEKGLYKLSIDPEFKALIRPLTQAERSQLEKNILKDGCRDAITTWHGVIVDGHNRYEICWEHSIPFAVEETEFSSRGEVVSWICSNQLGRRNLSSEMRRYLIGLQYESEKLTNAKKNAAGKNQYFSGGDEDKEPGPPAADGHITAERIARENHLAFTTVHKYSHYAKAIEVLKEKVPEIVPKILSGEFKISHENIIELSRLSVEEIGKVIRGIESRQESADRYKGPRNVMHEIKETEEGKVSVKDMPDFDPDAEITGLTLTIPSWVSSIERCRTKGDLTSTSASARNKLISALLRLKSETADLISLMEVGEHGRY